MEGGSGKVVVYTPGRVNPRLDFLSKSFLSPVVLNVPYIVFCTRQYVG